MSHEVTAFKVRVLTQMTTNFGIEYMNINSGHFNPNFACPFDFYYGINFEKKYLFIVYGFSMV